MNERPMPHSVEVEESLLGNMILYPDSAKETFESGLLSNDFYVEKHRKMFSVMNSMYERKEAIDEVSIISRLKSLNLLDVFGGSEFIAHLMASTVSNVNAKEYIKIIKNYSYKRQMIMAADKIAEDASMGNLVGCHNHLALIRVILNNLNIFFGIDI